MTLQGKSILVTGGAGFLGRHVVQELYRHHPGSLFVVRSKDYDLREQCQVRKLLADYKPDIVFHLAASVGGILANKANPGRYYYDNAAMGWGQTGSIPFTFVNLNRLSQDRRKWYAAHLI